MTPAFRRLRAIFLVGDTFLFWRGSDKTTNWTVETLANLFWRRRLLFIQSAARGGKGLPAARARADL